MNQKLVGTKNSMKMMWGCGALVVAAIVVSFSVRAGALFFVIPCVVMMGAMLWMMFGSRNSGPNGEQK